MFASEVCRSGPIRTAPQPRLRSAWEITSSSANTLTLSLLVQIWFVMVSSGDHYVLPDCHQAQRVRRICLCHKQIVLTQRGRCVNTKRTIIEPQQTRDTMRKSTSVECFLSSPSWCFTFAVAVVFLCFFVGSFVSNCCHLGWCCSLQPRLHNSTID